MKWVLVVILLVVSSAWASVFSNTLYYDAASAVDQLLISKGYEGQVVIAELSGETCYWVYYPDRFFAGSEDDALLMMTAFIYVGAVSRETSWASSLVFVVLRNKTFILPTSVARTAYELIEEDRVMDAMALIPTNTTDLETGTDDMGEAGVFPFSSSVSTSPSASTTRPSSSQLEEMVDTDYEHVIDEMVFSLIPSGSFSMGSPSSESDRYLHEDPVHTVSVQSFELMTTEVTQDLWEEVMGSNPASRFGVGSNYPVYNVSWNDCQEFIDRLNSVDTEYEYRLPSEAEWEYACRAGTPTRFYWGEDPDGRLIGQYCWFDENSDGVTHPVGQKLPNAWGLYDMSGNVWEWCEDLYHSSYTGAPTDGSAWVSGSDSPRVNRGGSFWFGAICCRSSYRDVYGPGECDGHFLLGLRLARSAR